MAGDTIKKVPGLLSLVLLLALTLTALRCNDEKHFAYQELIFVLPAKVLPDNNEVTIGDTLWVTVAISDSVYEFNTKKKYTLPDFRFRGAVVAVIKLIDKNLTLSEQLGGAADFDLIDEKGAVLSSSATFVGFKFFYDGPTGTNNLKIGFSPKRSGVYCFRFLGPDQPRYIDNYVNLGMDNNGAVIRPIYRDLYFPINMDGDNNYDLYADYCRALYYEAPDSVGYYLEYKGTFTFRVVE